MKKIIYVLLIMFLLTGCSFEYDIKIDKNYVKESGSVINTDKSTWNTENYLGNDMTYKEIINKKINTFEKVYMSDAESYIDPYEKYEGYDYYNIELINEKSKYGVKYFFNSKIDKYKDTRMLNMCYSSINVKNDKKIYTIKTSDTFECFDVYTMLDEVKVNITTSWDYKVINSNADKVENGKYTWIITKENAYNKPIKIELKRVFNWRLCLIIVVPTIIVITIAYFIIKGKLSKNNQI